MQPWNEKGKKQKYSNIHSLVNVEIFQLAFQLRVSVFQIKQSLWKKTQDE